MTLPTTFKRLFAILHAGVACSVICVLLGLAPFAVAQDVHHELAAADTEDGHEHSDNDLCQWVQLHISGSFDLDVSSLEVCQLAQQQELPSEAILLSIDLSGVGPSRAPPSI